MRPMQAHDAVRVTTPIRAAAATDEALTMTPHRRPGIHRHRPVAFGQEPILIQNQMIAVAMGPEAVGKLIVLD